MPGLQCKMKTAVACRSSMSWWHNDTCCTSLLKKVVLKQLLRWPRWPQLRRTVATGYVEICRDVEMSRCRDVTMSIMSDRPGRWKIPGRKFQYDCHRGLNILNLCLELTAKNPILSICHQYGQRCPTLFWPDWPNTFASVWRRCMFHGRGYSIWIYLVYSSVYNFRAARLSWLSQAFVEYMHTLRLQLPDTFRALVPLYALNLHLSQHLLNLLQDILAISSTKIHKVDLIQNVSHWFCRMLLGRIFSQLLEFFEASFGNNNPLAIVELHDWYHHS